MRRDSRTMCVDQEGRPSIGVLFVQGQEAARPQAMQAVSRASNLIRRGHPLTLLFYSIPTLTASSWAERRRPVVPP